MILYLIGTKAQYIKMAPVIKETARCGLPFKLVYTGQHSETFSDLQQNFGLAEPDMTLVNNAEATDRQSFARWLWRAVRSSRSSAAGDVFAAASCIVVHGDTASTLLGAYIARRYRRPLVHVEAGLRSYNYAHPFPEEAIRVMVSRFTSLHCCPDDIAVRNLKQAGVQGEVLHTSGNTLIDALHQACEGSIHRNEQEPGYGLFSMHRQENLFDGQRLDKALVILVDAARLMPIRFVLHPVTQRRLEKLGRLEALRSNPAISLVPRMDFFRFNRMLRRARFVITDGGSNQEECALLGIPCVVLRRATERADGLDGCVLLGDLDSERIVPFIRAAVSNPRPPAALPPVSPSSIIVERLSRFQC
jgi:UDP-N-acetylglucosamine 2-epimerase (non-hydrolysing)